MIRGTRDFWTGLLYIAFGASAVVLARDHGMGTAVRMGPAYFPTVLGALLILIGLIALGRSFIAAGAPVGPFALKALALIVGAIIVFGVVVRGAGLALALPALVMVTAAASPYFRWGRSIALAAALTLFCVVVFLKGLGVPLPILGPWFGG